MTLLDSVKIPLHPTPPERNGHSLNDGSFIRVWLWHSAPEGLRRQLSGRLKEPDFLVVCPRSCDQYSVKLFCDLASTEYRHCGEVSYEGVSCIAYITGRDA